MDMKTMKRRPLRRILAVAALLSIILAAFPVTNVRAGDYAIDDSSFEDISKKMEQMTVYTWHKGKPPEKIDGTLYPILLTWNGSYYMKNDENYDRYDDTKYRASKADGKSQAEGDFVVFKYQLFRFYDAGKKADLPLNLDALEEYGAALSLTLPNVPYVIATKGESNSAKDSYYAIGLDYNEPTEKSRFLRGYLAWSNDIDEDLCGTDMWVCQDADWLLKQDSYLRSIWTEDKTIEYNYTAWGKTKSAKMTLKNRTWRIREESNGKYSFNCYGNTVERFEDSSPGWLAGNDWIYKDAVKSYKGNMYLRHEKPGEKKEDKLGSYGWTPKGTGDAEWALGSEAATVDNTDGSFKITNPENNTFDLYYATPMPMSFIKGNYTVQNGQTTNLNGPICINKNVTITVEDGGVLNCTGWVVNNGRIIVKPGGTLVVNSDDAGNQGVVCVYSPAEYLKYGGCVVCDGTIVVMPGCELCCSGNIGLALGAQAQVANYGTVIATRGQFYGDHVLENRTADSLTLLGYEVIDGGYTLTAANPVINGRKAEYPGMGENIDVSVYGLPAGGLIKRRIYMVPGAIYGDDGLGKSRTFYHSLEEDAVASPKEKVTDMSIPEDN